MIKDRLLIGTIILFTLFFIIGLVPGLINESAMNENSGELPNIEHTPSTSELAINNGMVVALLLAGSLTFGITTIVNISLNGMYLGLIVSQGISGGLAAKTVAFLIIPHSIFELPALWIAGAAGLKIPKGFVKYLRNERKEIVQKDDLKTIFHYSIVSYILIFIGAWVEGNITPIII